MKVFVGIVGIAAVVLCFGFFVSQNLSASSDLVTLSNVEMMQQTGGVTMGEKAEEGGDLEEDIMQCSLEDCPSGSKTYKHPRYRCVPCLPENTARTSMRDYKEEKSYCQETRHYKTGKLLKCELKAEVISMWRTCKKVTGHCPTTS